MCQISISIAKLAARDWRAARRVIYTSEWTNDGITMDTLRQPTVGLADWRTGEQEKAWRRVEWPRREAAEASI